jgi:hypothetical protein
LYVSLHRGSNGALAKENDYYPQGLSKGAKFTGQDDGLGFNINLPWSQPVGQKLNLLIEQIIFPLSSSDLALVMITFHSFHSQFFSPGKNGWRLRQCISPIGSARCIRGLSIFQNRSQWERIFF